MRPTESVGGSWLSFELNTGAFAFSVGGDVNERLEKGSGFAGQQMVVLPARIVERARQQKPLLRGLLVAGAGYFPKAAGHWRRRPTGLDQAILIYCARGGGWYEIGPQVGPVRAGDLLVVPPGLPHAYGANRSNPWTIHWVHAVGTNLPEYLRELGVSAQNPLVNVGENLQLVLLFNEALKCLERGFAFEHLLQASQAIGHLLSLIIQQCRQRRLPESDSLQKVARCIVHMSEHLDQPLKVSTLAALASLSPAHFTVLFKEQTGSAPRRYLHLLRMHQACRWLTGAALPVKEIAGRLGYQDPFHFSRQFKAFSGLPPSEYRLAQHERQA
jgi:AraC family transcriptional regulator, arabinose operon regulatory protein